jgi:ureidoglycolate lyase
LKTHAQPLTEAAFAPFGFVLDVPTGGRRTGPHEIFADARGDAKLGVTLISLMPSQRPRRVAQIERHINAVQYFLHLSGGPVSLVVFPTQTDGSPDLARPHAYRAQAGQSFGYHKGTWHAGVAALGEAACVASILSRDGTQADVEEHAVETPIEVDWT